MCIFRWGSVILYHDDHWCEFHVSAPIEGSYSNPVINNTSPDYTVINAALHMLTTENKLESRVGA